MFYKFLECSRIFFLRKYDSLYESYEILEYFTIYKPANFCQFYPVSFEVKWNKKVRQNQYNGNFRKKHLSKKVLLKKNFYFDGRLFLFKLFTINNNNKGYFLNDVVLFTSQASPGILFWIYPVAHHTGECH